MAGNPSIIWMAAAGRYGSAAGDGHDAHGKAQDAPGVRTAPRARWARSWTGAGDDVGEVVVPVVESVVGQLQRPPGGLFAAEVAELAGYVVGQRTRAAMRPLSQSAELKRAQRDPTHADRHMV